MADPLRLRILKALTTSLQGITVDNGYVNDLSDGVYRGRTMFGDADELPLVSILEAPIPLEQIESPESHTANFGDWDLLIQGFVKDDPKNPTDPAHVLMADVKRALAKERKKLNNGNNNILGMAGKVDRLEIGAGVVRPADEISAVAYFWLRVTLKIVEDNENPYV